MTLASFSAETSKAKLLHHATALFGHFVQWRLKQHFTHATILAADSFVYRLLIFQLLFVFTITDDGGSGAKRVVVFRI